uniref:R13L1/DRL21-like LRR repeat region domain-containing protein n=1 Tax=Chenopodium quinoa TaxID=63459 RepID=A0A803LYQ4_CHEQI
MVANAYKINNGREGGCLENKEHLNCVVLYFVNKKEEEREEYDEAVMEELQPINSNLKMLVVKGYQVFGTV